MLSEWENCKISNLSSEDFDKDGRENKKSFQRAATVEILQRFVFTNEDVKMVRYIGSMSVWISQS